MSEINYSTLLRELVMDYFERRLSRVEYLAQRRSLLDRVDHEFNGPSEESSWPEPDDTQPAQFEEVHDITNVPPPRPDISVHTDEPSDEYASESVEQAFEGNDSVESAIFKADDEGEDETEPYARGSFTVANDDLAENGELPADSNESLEDKPGRDELED